MQKALRPWSPDNGGPDAPTREARPGRPTGTGFVVSGAPFRSQSTAHETKAGRISQVTEDSAAADRPEETTEDSAEGMREQTAALRWQAEQDRIEDLWRQGADAMRAQWAGQGAKLAAIHREVRTLGDMVIRFTARLEALENAKANDFRDAWAQGDDTTTAPSADVGSPADQGRAQLSHHLVVLLLGCLFSMV